MFAHDRKRRPGSAPTVAPRAALPRPGSHIDVTCLAVGPRDAPGAPRVGDAAGPHEREAARAAEQVLRMPEPGPRTARPGGVPATAGTSGARGGGEPLAEATRQFFEPRFGHDFSQVRVFADAPAAHAARGVGARAYTLGSNIVFGAREYAPGTHDGQRLLAHELSHVVQQSGAMHAAHGLSPVRTPTIQRELVATGDTAGFAALCNGIITTQLRVAVDAGGKVTLVGTDVQGPPTREAQGLTQALRRIIGDRKTTTVAFIHGATSRDAIDQQVMIGSYAAARIDLDDIGQLSGGEGLNAGSALAHELVEQYRKQVFSEGYPAAHAAGMAEEEAVTGARRGASTRREIDATSYEIEVAYHYPDRTVFVTRVVRNQNIIAVRRRTTRP